MSPSSVLPRTLTARLVVTTVALVAVVGVVVALSATLAMRSYLTDRLDSQVRDALRIATGPQFGGGPDAPGTPQGRQFRQAPGTLIAVDPVEPGAPTGAGILTRSNAARRLSGEVAQSLAAVPTDREAHTVHTAGASYRVMSTRDGAGNVFVLGLPTAAIDNTIASMLRWFVLLTLLGVGAAGVLGTWLVRRQMRPLYAVAETARAVSTQDLSSGDTAIETRVPDGLVDARSEVGQVGAALNTLLDHVDVALSARHRSEQQVRQFVADASHELRTPLATIHGYAELARRQLTGAAPDDAAALSAALGKVETEADRMSELVADLLLLARLDAGRALAREVVDLTRLLLEAVADARVVAPDHTWRLVLPDQPVTVTGDEARLHQAVTNLLNNAGSHTPPGTTVTVSVGADAREVRVAVHDDGPGLPPELVGEAFDRFTRGESSRTRTSGGAGLGLSLVSAIAEAHGGRASVTSRPADTTFTVVLPR